MATLPLTLDTLQTSGDNETPPLMSPQILKTVVGNDSSLTTSIANEMEGTPERPTNLTLESTTTTISTQQQQQQHSYLTPSSATTTTIHGNISPALSSAGSLSPSFLPEMPQWKRDLIQRRKQNVQRTISASSPTSSSTSSIVAASSATILSSSPTSAATLLAAGGSLKTSTSSSSVRSLAGSNTNIDQLASDGFLPQNCSTKDFTKTKLKPASSSSLTTTTSSLLSSPLKEKSEKLFGGQYTATATSTLFTHTTKEEEITNTHLNLNKSKELNKEEHETKENQQQQQSQEEEELLLNDETQLAIITSKQQQLQQQQQLHMATRLTGSIHNINTTTASSSSSSSTCSNISSISGTTVNVKRTEREDLNNITGALACVNNKQQNVKQSLNKCESERLLGAANNLLNITGNNIINNKTIGVISNNSVNNISNNSAASSNNNNNNNSVLINNKISQKLQENQFIKNEQQQQINNKKFIKFNKQNTITGDLKSPTKINKSSLVSSNSAHSLLQTTNYCATSSTSSSTAGFLTGKKKMVAVQDIKKSSQTKPNHLNNINSNCQAANRLNNRNNMVSSAAAAGGNGVVGVVGVGGGGLSGESSGNDLDNPEDLSYGPGIVSKLRCRYLSLALRESMEQQRLNKDQLRRSTSLNNLLDNCDEDEEEEEEEEEEVDQEGLEELKEINAENQENIQNNLIHKKMGILKSSKGQQQQQQQKRFSSSAATQQGSHGVGVTFTETSYHQRSRHLKRGNDSLKRARSVEALLSEKSPWHGKNNYTNSSQTVSIEDKIHNARERLQQGIEHLPPKRLTSIIDDTERPPPDLVKQTLKMFEASANRRPKTQNLNNAKGEVASKVETFKNIIKEQKPTITYPKPLSPSKKLNSPLITQQKSLKSPLQAQDLMQTPLGRKTSKVVNNEAASTPLKSNNLSEHTPDIIPRQKFNSSSSQERDFKQNKEFLQQNTNTNKRDLLNKEKYEIDSPVTALSKELSKMKINETTPMKIIKKDNDLKQQKHNQSDSNNKIEEVNRDLEGGVNVEVNVNEEGDACQQYNNEQQQTQININSSLLNENDKIANKNQPQQNENTEAIALKATTAATVTITEEINIQKTTTKNEKLHEVKFNNYDSLTKATSITSTSTPPPPTKTSNALSDEDDENDHQEGEEESTKRITRSALDNIAKAGYTQQFKFNNSTINNSNNTSNLSPLNSGKQIGVIKPLLQQQPTPISQQQQQQKENSLNMDSLKHSSPSSLTSREIEKNRINDLKKSSSQNSSLSTPPPSSNTSSASLTHTSTPNTTATAVAGASAGYSDVDSVISATNSPLWAMRKRRQAPPAAPAENTSMVFNFSNRKEVPDYIENDGVIFRRKRELPKPNESGFVLLGDLSVETSTDMDYDDFSMCPPSPCDVEFVNANIVIDGKSSIRQKSKDTTFRVQFNDTLTSTFEYPSEASLIMDDSFSAYNEGYTQPHGSCSTADDFTQAFQNLCLEQSAINQHHHVADEIIQLPPTLNNSSTPANASNNTPSKNILGNLPLDYPDLQKGIPLTTAQQLTTPTMATLDLKVTDNEPTILEEQKKSRKDLNLPLKQQQQQQKPPLPVKRFLMKNSPVVAATVATPKISYIKNSNVNLKNYVKKPQQNHEIIKTKEIPQVFPTKGEENVMIPKMKGDLPKVLNNPQYACFLMDTTTTTATAIKSPIQRSRSNEFQKKFSTFSLNANVVSRSNSLRNLEAPKQFSLTTTTATQNAAGSTTNYFNQEVNLENIFNSILKPHLAKVEKSLDSGKDKAFLKPGNCIKNTERCKSLNNLQEYKENPLNIKETLKHSQDNLNLKKNSQEFNKSKEIFENLELKSLENINSSGKLLKKYPKFKVEGSKIPETYLNLEIPLKIDYLESSKNPVIMENGTINIPTNLAALPLKSSLKSENLFEYSKDFVKIQEKSWEIKQKLKENNIYVQEESPNPNKINKNSLNLKSNFNNKSMTSDGDIKNLASFANKANVMETNLAALSLETFDRQEDFPKKSKDLLKIQETFAEKSCKINKNFLNLETNSSNKSITSKGALKCPTSLEHKAIVMETNLAALALKTFDSQEDLLNSNFNNKSISSTENLKNMASLETNANGLDLTALSSDCLNKSEYMKKLSEKFPNSQNLSKSLMNVKEMSQHIDTNTQNSSNINSLEFPITRKSYENFNSKATLENEVNVMESNLAALSMETSHKLEDILYKSPTKAEATVEHKLNVVESNLAALSKESSNKLENMPDESLAKVKNFQKEAVTILKEREITQNSCEVPQNSSNLKSLEFPMTINSYENLNSEATLENEINVIKTNLSALSIKTSNTLEDIPDKSSAKAENSPRERGSILKNRELSQNSHKVIQNSLNSESLELSLNCCENVNTLVTLGNSESNLTALSSNKPENPLDTQRKSKELKEFVTKSNEIVFKAKTKENSLEFPENSLEFPENFLDSSHKKQKSLNCNKKLNLQQSLSNCGKLYNKETLDIKGKYVDNNLAALSLNNKETLRKSEELNNDLKHFENLSNFKAELIEIVKNSNDLQETPEVLLKTQENSLKLKKFSLNSPRKNHCNLNANKSLELPKFLNTSDKLKRVASFDYETYNPESNLTALSLGALNNLEILTNFQQKSKETTKQMENSQTLDSLNETNTPWELKNSLENNQSYGNPPKPLKRLSLTLNKTYLTDYKSHITQNLAPREIKSWENLSLNNKDPKANLLDSKANSQESLSLSVNAENLQEYSFKIKDNLINKRLKYQSKSQDDLQEEQTLSLSFKHKTISNENIRDFNEYSLYRNITTTNKSSLKLINSPKSNKKSRDNFSKSIFIKRRCKSVDNIDMNVNNVNLTFIHSKSVNNLDSSYKTKTLSHFLSKSMDNINSITNSNLTDEFKEFLNENYFNFKLKNNSTENLSNIELINPKTPLKDLNKSLLMSLDSLDAYEDAQDYMTLENDNEDLLTSEILEDINIGLNTSSQYDFHNLLTLKKSKTSYCLQNLNKSYSLESESNSEDNFASACNTLESKWSVKPAEKPLSNTASIPNAPNQKIPSKKPKTFRVKTTEKLLTLTQMASHNVNSYATFRKSKNLYKNASKTFKNSMKFYENFSEKSLEKIMKPKSSMKRSISLTENVVKTAEINRKIFAKSEKLMRKVRQINEEESPTENSNSFEYFEAGEEGLRKEEYQEEENKIEEKLQENSKEIQETFINKQSPAFLDKIKPLATLTSEKMAALSLEENYPNFLFEKENLTNSNEINNKETEIQRNLAALALEFPNNQENQTNFLFEATNLIDSNQENNKQTKIKRNLAALALEFPKKQETQINFLFEAKNLPDSNQETNKQIKIKRDLAALALKFPNKQENHQNFLFKTKNLPDSDTTNNKQTKIKRNLAALALDSLNKAEIYSDFSIKTESLQDSNKKINNLINFSGNLAALSLEFPNKQENRTNFLFKTKNLPDFKQKNNEQTKIKRNLAALSLEFLNKQENQQDFLFKIDFNKKNNKEIYIKRNLAALSLESLNERIYPDFLIKTEIMPDSNNRNGEQIKIANNLAALSLDSLNQQKSCHPFLDKKLNLPNFFNNKDKLQENLNKNSIDLEISKTQNSPNKLKRMASLQHEIVDIDINLAAQQENRRETIEKTDKLFETKKNSNDSLKSNGNSLKNIKEINGNSAKNFDDLKKVQEVLNTKGNFILKDNSEAKEYLSKTRFHSKEISFNSYYPKDNLNFCQIPRSPEIISSETSNKSNKSLEQLCVKEKSTNLNFNSGPRPFKRLYESNTKKEEQEIGIKTKKAPEDAALKSLQANDSKLFSDLTSLESQCFIENKSNNFKENLNSTASCQNSKTSSTSHPRFSSNKVKFNVYSSTPTKSLKTKSSLENSLETKECLSWATDFTPLVVTSLTISTLSKPLEEECILTNSYKGIKSFTSSNDFKQKFPENSLKSSHNFQSVEYIPQILKNISNTNNCEESFGESGKLSENFSKSPKNFSKSLENSLECGKNSLKVFNNSQTFENSLNIKELSGKQENKKDSLSIPLRSPKDFQNLSQFPGNSLKFSENSLIFPENSLNNSSTLGNTLNFTELSGNQENKKDSLSLPLSSTKVSNNSSKFHGNPSKFSENSLKPLNNFPTPGNSPNSQSSSKFPENSLNFHKNSLNSSNNASTPGNSLNFTELSSNERIEKDSLPILLRSTKDTQNSFKFPENSSIIPQYSLEYPNDSQTSKNFANFTEIPKDLHKISYNNTNSFVNPAKYPGDSFRSSQTAPTCKSSSNFPGNAQTVTTYKDATKITLRPIKTSANSAELFEKSSKFPGNFLKSPKDYQTTENLLKFAGNSLKFQDNFPTLGNSFKYSGTSFCNSNSKDHNQISLRLSKAYPLKIHENSSKFLEDSLKSLEDYSISLDSPQTAENSTNIPKVSKINLTSKGSLEIPLHFPKTCDKSNSFSNVSTKVDNFSDKSCHTKLAEDTKYKITDTSQLKASSFVCRNLTKFSHNLIPKDAILCFENSPCGRTLSDNLSENSKKIGDNNSQISENSDKFSENTHYFHKNSVPVQSQGLEILNSNQNSLSKVESFVENSYYSQRISSSKEDHLAFVPEMFNLNQNLSPKVETFVRNSNASQIAFNLIKYSSNSVKIADNSPTNNNSNNYEKTVAKSPNNCKINENSINYQSNSSSKSNTPESNTPEICRIVENSSAKVETFVRNSNGCQFSFNLIKYSQNSPKIPDNSPVKQGPSKFQEKSPKSADINQISQNPNSFKGTVLKSSNNSQISKSSFVKEENSPKYPDKSEIYNGSYNKSENFPNSLDNFEISQNLRTLKGTALKSSNNSQFSENSYMKNEISPNNLEICYSSQQFCGSSASLNSFNLNRDSQNSSKIFHNSPATEIPNNFKGNSLKFPDNSQFTKNAKLFPENNSIKEDSLSTNFWENSPKFPKIIPQDNLNPSSITSDDCNKFPGNAINQIETKKFFANTFLIGNCNTTPLEESKCVTRSSSTLITRNNFNSASSQLLTATHLKLNPNINKLNDHNFNKTPIPQPTTTTTTTNNKLTTTPTTTTTTTPTTILATTIPTLTVKDFEQNIAKDFNNFTTTTLISTFTTNFPTKVVALTNTKETTTTKSINISSSCSSFSSSPIPNKTWATTAKYQQQNQQQQFEKVITTTTKSPPLTTSTTITTSTLSTTKINPPHVLPRRVFNNNLKTTRATTTTMTCNTSSIKSSTATSSSSSSTCSSSTTCISSVNNINNNVPPPLPPLRRRIPGSAPLGFYTPLKAPIDRLFQLGVTRAPSLMSNIESPTTETTATTTTSNGGSRLYNGISSLGNHNDDDDNGEGGNGSIVGISGGLIQDDYDDVSNKKRILKAANNLEEEEEEPESLQYIKPAEDDLNMAYSEGTQKTDLLY